MRKFEFTFESGVVCSCGVVRSCGTPVCDFGFKSQSCPFATVHCDSTIMNMDDITHPKVIIRFITLVAASVRCTMV